MITLDTDQIAALALAYGTKAEQATIRRQLEHAHGEACPSCDARDIDHSSGQRPSEVTFCCLACERQWEADDIDVTLPARCPKLRP